MVGYAYSLDYAYGYGYIFIKAYDADDLSFVNSATPSVAYRVKRDNIRVELVQGSPYGKLIHLSLHHIEEMLTLISLEEYDKNYPVCMSWCVTPSGNLLKKKANEFYSVWPVPPKLMTDKNFYVNITNISFKSKPSVLELSFAENVLNMVLFLCGVYVSEPLCVCGNALYLSKEIADLIYKLYGSLRLYSFIPNECKFKKQKFKIKAKNIIKKAEQITFADSKYEKDVSEWIVNIKRECAADLISIIISSLENKRSFNWLVRRLRYTVSKYYRNFLDIGTELISHSMVQASTDIKKLKLNELLMAFTFADSMRDIPKNIRASKERLSAINKLLAPGCIYNGRFYYKEKQYEN